jgi:hypothetical protein
VDARDSATFLFNGRRWSSGGTVPSTQTGMASVSCSSPSFCAAVDYGPNVVTFNGTSWSKPSAIDPGTYLQAVSCASASFCVARQAQVCSDTSTASVPGDSASNTCGRSAG